MQTKAMVIVNPASANGTTRTAWPAIADKLASAGLQFDWAFTGGPGDATRMATEALRGGYGYIISVGGDGTLNEVVNGWFENDRPINPKAMIGLISRGTGCDFIKTMGLSKDLDAAVACLMGEGQRTIDVGKVRFVAHSGQQAERYFANVADLGLGGDTVDRVNKTSKALGGFVSFLWGTLVSLFRYRNRTLEFKVDDGDFLGARATVLAIANGCYFGGGMFIAPEADPSDGQFDVVLCDRFGKLEVIWNLQRLYKGTHLTHPKVSLVRGKKVVVRSNQRVLLDVDGEQPGVAEAEFTLLPACLNVRVLQAGK